MSESQNQGLISPEEFDDIALLLPRFTKRILAILRQVLVDGKPQSFVADANGMSRQRVSYLTRRATQALQIPRGWKKIQVWLPEEKAAEVKKMAYEERMKTNGVNSL